jgi:hypothetical protein
MKTKTYFTNAPGRPRFSHSWKNSKMSGWSFEGARLQPRRQAAENLSAL